MSHGVIAYTYEADHHCEACASARFGLDEHGEIEGVDDEGNEVGALFGWDEWHVCSEHLDSFPDYPATLVCGDCGTVLDGPCEGCAEEIEVRARHGVRVERKDGLWTWRCSCTEERSQYFALRRDALLEVIEHLLGERAFADTILVTRDGELVPGEVATSYRSVDRFDATDLLAEITR